METVRIPKRVHAFLTRQGAYQRKEHDRIGADTIASIVELTGPREQLAALGEYLSKLADMVDSGLILVKDAGHYNQHLLKAIVLRFPAQETGTAPNLVPDSDRDPVYLARMRPERTYTTDGGSTVTITETTTGADKGTYRLPTRTGSLYDAAGALLAMGWEAVSAPMIDSEGAVSVRIAPADLLTGTPDQDNPTAVKAVMALSSSWEPARIPRDSAHDWGNVPGLRGFVVEPVCPGNVFVVQAKQQGDPDLLRSYAATLLEAGWRIVSVTSLRVEASSPGN